MVIRPQNMAERVIWSIIVFSYPMYFLGLIFPVNTIVPWLLLVPAAWRLWQQSDLTPASDRIKVSILFWVWLAASVVVLVALLVGLIDFEYDQNEIIRSCLNWSREWALFPICVFLGNCLPVRSALIYRAVCWLCAQSLGMIMVSYGAYLAKLPEVIYYSPIERLTQNGKMFYEIRWYLIDVDSETLRLTLFAPWAPALGLVSCVYFILALQERQRGWKIIGLLGAIAMIVASVSRSAFLFLPATLVLLWVWLMENRAYLQIALGCLAFLVSVFSASIGNAIETAVDIFVGARKSSSQLRETLQRVAFDRWSAAPIWGHGKQIQGPHLLKKMPLGSHHTWFGLLFTHGVIGFTAVLMASVSTIVILAWRAKHNTTAQAALGVFMLLLFTSLGENMEKLAYLIWPALMLMGMASRNSIQDEKA
jgi:hypothetical protein